MAAPVVAIATKRTNQKKKVVELASLLTYSTDDIFKAIDDHKVEHAKELLKTFLSKFEELAPVALKAQARGEKKERARRGPTTYNVFLSAELKKMKGDKSIPHKERMKIALAHWREYQEGLKIMKNVVKADDIQEQQQDQELEKAIDDAFDE